MSDPTLVIKADGLGSTLTGMNFDFLGYSSNVINLFNDFIINQTFVIFALVLLVFIFIGVNQK